jgi:GNAT superfamily N-acetyltransferase
MSEIQNNGTLIRLAEYDIRLLTRTHLSQLMTLQDVIVSGLQQPDLFEPYQLSWIQDRIENRGYVIGAFAGENLAAFCHVYYPDVDDTERNYGFDMGFDEAERLHVVNLLMFCVHPRYRGNGLAITLNRLALSKIQQEASRHYHVCSSVSPYNLYSLRVLLDAGLFIKVLTHKYGGKLRYIVHRDLRHSDAPRLEALKARTQSTAAGNLSVHQQLLDDGYWGFKLIQPSDKPQASRNLDFHNCHVVFGKSGYDGR